MTVDTAALQRLLVAEDARGTGRDGVVPILEGLRSRDTLLRRVAVRAAGRLQRPGLAQRLYALLDDTSPSIRAEAANAIAQSLRNVRRGESTNVEGQRAVIASQQQLTSALAREKNTFTAGIMARSLGRLPLPDTASARAAERAIVSSASPLPEATYDHVHGLYRLALARRFTGPLATDATELLRRNIRSARAADTRRLAVLALRQTGALDSAVIFGAFADSDAQVRRLALSGALVLSPGVRAQLVQRAFADASPIVRIEAVNAARTGSTPQDCSPIIAATRDGEPHVMLSAIDALGSPCADTAAAHEALRVIVEMSSRANAKSRDLHFEWQFRTHATLALARAGYRDARALSPHIPLSSPEEQVYVVRAAAIRSDTARLLLLAMSRPIDHNVHEAAIQGLSRFLKHEADSVYVAALTSKGYQVVLAAAQALAGSTDARALPKLYDAFDRLSAERRENARDPRMEILKRISEMGSRDGAPRLRRYLTDFDTTVAQTVAGMITKWTGDSVVARPRPLPIRAEPLARLFLQREVKLRVTMAGPSGGSFVIRLFTDEAPATAARLIRLARSGYFDGHVFQRVEPNFVIQGGGPDANEYVGDAAFMRDEVSFRPHKRRTVGISSRGRDTGDGQIFVNLADNPVLDHEYTVAGEVVEGMAVLDRMMEGGRIGTVTLLPAISK